MAALLNCVSELKLGGLAPKQAERRVLLSLIPEGGSICQLDTKKQENLNKR